jgi:predicted RNA-binding protein with PUA-like domain
MAYWLLKTEPSVYSLDDLATAKSAPWDGVANPTALIHLRTMKPADTCLIYHTGNQKQIVGTATVIKPAYPDPKNPKLVIVDLAFASRFSAPVTLAAIKSNPAFTGWDLLRIGRLSVVPTPAAMYNQILKLSKSATK